MPVAVPNPDEGFGVADVDFGLLRVLGVGPNVLALGGQGVAGAVGVERPRPAGVAESSAQGGWADVGAGDAYRPGRAGCGCGWRRVGGPWPARVAEPLPQHGRPHLRVGDA